MSMSRYWCVLKCKYSFCYKVSGIAASLVLLSNTDLVLTCKWT